MTLPAAIITERKAQLVARRGELDTRLHGIDAELDTHQSKDWQDAATERETDEVLQGMGEAGLNELKMIDMALERIEAGEYGACAMCGADINPARLDVLPYTPVCRDCAKGRS
ncbi:MAG: RNA polymerase-binding transcription factor DksA [Sulfitobacter sp.]|jgi:RNA polymerase-binding transcription factor DksA